MSLCNTMSRFWWCPSCNNGSDKNHRKCMARDFAYNGTEWEAACLRAGAQRAKKHLIEFSELSPFWIKKTNAYAVLPPGSYFIGDVHTSLPSGLLPKLREGAYSSGDQIYVAGKALHSRAIPGSNGFRYDIRSGYIGIMTVNLCSNMGSGSYHTFMHPVEVTLDDSILVVKSDTFTLKIDTRIDETLG